MTVSKPTRVASRSRVLDLDLLRVVHGVVVHGVKLSRVRVTAKEPFVLVETALESAIDDSTDRPIASIDFFILSRAVTPLNFSVGHASAFRPGCLSRDASRDDAARPVDDDAVATHGGRNGVRISRLVGRRA